MSEAKRTSEAKSTSQPAVYIIDDDASVRIALERLLISTGIRARTFASAHDFLKADVPLDGTCVITDVKMQGMTGLELHQKLRADGVRVAFIFVTAYDTDDARAQAKKAGAVAYFRKPVDDQALIDAIEWALSKSEGKT
jgi:FixJ family two-component response regulator